MSPFSRQNLQLSSFCLPVIILRLRSNASAIDSCFHIEGVGYTDGGLFEQCPLAPRFGGVSSCCGSGKVTKSGSFSNYNEERGEFHGVQCPIHRLLFTGGVRKCVATKKEDEQSDKC